MLAFVTTNRCIYRWPTQRARKWLGDFLVRARRDPNILAVVAIGSAVRPGVPSDDLDIIVVCTCSRDLSERAPLGVDLCAFDVSDVDAKIEAGNDLLVWAVVFGRAIFDRQQTWRRIVERWANRVPLPNPEIARARAATTFRRMKEMREMGDNEAAVELEVAYLTHCARGVLAAAGVYAASRPELPDQLRAIGAQELATKIDRALEARMHSRRQLVG